MELVIQPFASLPNRQDIEIFERKGLGHPDTLCDAIAERICVRLCRGYLDRFDMVLHHNVDKVLLCAGASRPLFGGGTVPPPDLPEDPPSLDPDPRTLRSEVTGPGDRTPREEPR